MNLITEETYNKLEKAGLIEDYMFNDLYVDYDEEKGNQLYTYEELEENGGAEGFRAAIGLDELIDIIGKNMAQVRILYPNGGNWLLGLIYGEDIMKETALECFEEFVSRLLKDGELR